VYVAGPVAPPKLPSPTVPASSELRVDASDAFDPFPASFRKAKSLKKVAFSAEADDDKPAPSTPAVSASRVQQKPSSVRAAVTTDAADLLSDDDEADVGTALKPLPKKIVPVHSLRASQAAKQRPRDKLEHIEEGEAECVYCAVHVLAVVD
jgi:hypothetical protein